MDSIKLNAKEISRITPLFKRGLKEQVESCISNLEQLKKYKEHNYIIEEYNVFSSNLIYTLEVYEYGFLLKISEFLHSLVSPVHSKFIKVNNEIIILLAELFEIIKDWSDNSEKIDKEISKKSDEIKKRIDCVLEFAYLAKKKDDEISKKNEQTFTVTSTDMKSMKECLYDVYTNYSYMSEELHRNLPLYCRKQKWFEDYKNNAKSFLSNLTALQKEYFNIRKYPLKPLLEEIEYEIRTRAMNSDKQVEIIFKHNDIKIDVYYVEILSEIMKELFKNSVDHSFNAGDDTIKSKSKIYRIESEFSETEDAISLNIKDNGKGFDYGDIIENSKKRNFITDADMHNISQLFFNILLFHYHGTKKNNNKIGLKTVKKNLDKLNASISFKIKNSGTDITIEFPKFKKIV